MNKPLAEDHLESHSSDVQCDTKNNMKEYAEECSGSAQGELRERTSDHDSRIKVLKPEDMEVIIAAGKRTVSENRRYSQARFASFCLRSETSCITPILNVECTEPNKLMPRSSPSESHKPGTAELYCERQKPIESAILTRSDENEEPENPPEKCSSEEITIESKFIRETGLSSSEMPKIWEDKNGSSSQFHEADYHVNVVEALK